MLGCKNIVYMLSPQHVPTFCQIMLIHGNPMKETDDQMPKRNGWQIPANDWWVLDFVWAIQRDLRKQFPDSFLFHQESHLSLLSARQILRSFLWSFPKPVLGGYQCVNKPVYLLGSPSTSRTVMFADTLSTLLVMSFFSVYSTIVQYIFFFGRHPRMLVPILTTCLHGVLNYLTYLPYSWVCLSLFKVICCFQMENPPLDPFGEPTPQQTQIGNWHVCDLGGTSNQDQPSPGVNSRIVDRNCRRTV